MPPNTMTMTITNDTIIQSPVPTNPTKIVRFCHRRPSVGLTFSKWMYDRSGTTSSSSVVEDDSDDDMSTHTTFHEKKPRRASAPFSLSSSTFELTPLTCSPPPDGDEHKPNLAPLDELALYKTKLAVAKGKDYHWAPLARIRRDSAP